MIELDQFEWDDQYELLLAPFATALIVVFGFA
jgi:hypothetical protein